MAFLGPQSIGNTQLDALLVARFAQLSLECAEGGMDLSLVFVEAEDSAHLLLGFAARAGIGHRQGRGDAVGREEQVARTGFELAVEVQGKGRVALNRGFSLSRSGGGRRAENE